MSVTFLPFPSSRAITGPIAAAAAAKTKTKDENAALIYGFPTRPFHHPQRKRRTQGHRFHLVDYLIDPQRPRAPATQQAPTSSLLLTALAPGSSLSRRLDLLRYSRTMASHVVIVDSSFRRANIKCTPNTFLSDVLVEACQRLKLPPEHYGLK